MHNLAKVKCCYFEIFLIVFEYMLGKFCFKNLFFPCRMTSWEFSEASSTCNTKATWLLHIGLIWKNSWLVFFRVESSLSSSGWNRLVQVWSIWLYHTPRYLTKTVFISFHTFSLPIKMSLQFICKSYSFGGNISSIMKKNG